MRFWLTIVMLSTLCTSLVVGQQRVDEFSESGDSLTLSDAVRYTTDGVKNLKLFDNVEQAQKLFESAIESDSTYSPAYYALAEMLMYSSADTAYLYAKKAYLSDTSNVRYLSSYAQSAAMLERFDEAQTLHEKLIERQPRNINAYRILAILLNQQKQPLKAVELLDSAEMKVGRNPYLVGLKRQILISNNYTDRVVEDAKSAVEDEPYSIENRVLLAELYRDMKQDSLALVEYKGALALDSMRLETLFSMGEFLKVKGDNAGYLSLLKQILKSDQIDETNKIALVKELIDDREFYRREYLLVGGLITTLIVEYPNNESIVEMQAKHLIAMDMLDEALAMFKSHLNIDPPSFKIYRSVIDIERYKGRLDSVELYLNRAMVKFPDQQQDLEFERAFTLSSQQRFDDAIALYEEFLVGANDSMSGSIWGIIGDLHHQVAISSDPIDKKVFRSRLKKSYKAYDKSLSYMADNAMVLNNYAYFLCEYGGNLERALSLSEHSIELEPSNSTFIDTYAWILYRLGRYDEAKVSMRRAISLDTTQNGEIALHYGEILAALNEMTMANYYWGKAIEWGMSESQVEASRRAAAELATKREKRSKKGE
ncbi:MAG: tetratricopeptide repeat protein [Rikenellaceae bacterium]